MSSVPLCTGIYLTVSVDEVRPGSMITAAKITMQRIPLPAPHAEKSIAAFGMTRSSRPRALRAVLRTYCSAQIDSTNSPRKHVRANGLNFVVDDHGEIGATPVILLHGFPNSANVWERQVYVALLSALRS